MKILFSEYNKTQTCFEGHGWFQVRNTTDKNHHNLKSPHNPLTPVVFFPVHL